jgi:hypothetical protein
MIAEQHYGAHSANIEMRLIINGSSIGITHMGSDFLFIEPASEHPPGLATIFLQVDQFQRQWAVRLPDGISSQSNRVALALAE